MSFIVATNVVASRLPKRRLLVPIKDENIGIFCYYSNTYRITTKIYEYRMIAPNIEIQDYINEHRKVPIAINMSIK